MENDAKIIAELIKSGETVKFYPNGTSMRPLLKTGRDFVVCEPLKTAPQKGDILLYRYGGRYVVHRVHSINSHGEILMLGDGNITIESPLCESNIFGIVSIIGRKGKEINVKSNFLYKLYSGIWVRILPIRKLVFKARFFLRNHSTVPVKISKDILTVLNCADKNTEMPSFFKPEWDKLLPAIYANKLEALVGDYILSLNENAPDKDMTEFLDEYTFHQRMRQSIAEAVVGNVFECFKKSGVHAAVLKGFVLACNYPHPEARYSDDIDIYAPGENFDSACEILEELGFKKMLEESEGQIGTVEYALGDKCLIELHREIAVNTSAKRFAAMKEAGLFDENNFIPFKYNDIEIATVEPTSHLIYIIYHTAKHFIHSNAEGRMLCDISLFVNSNFDKIDFDLFRKTMKLMELDKFCSGIFNVCAKYFNMNKNALCDEDYIKNYDIRKMLNTFLTDMLKTKKSDMQKLELVFSKHSRIERVNKISLKTKLAYIKNLRLIFAKKRLSKKWRIY